MPVDFDGILASAVESVLGESVLVTRTSGGTYSPADRAYLGSTTIGPVVLTADVQAINRVVRSGAGGGGLGGGEVDLDEVALNFRASSVAATALGDIRDGDLVSVRGRARVVVSVTWQAGASIIRVIARSEKRQKPTA